MSGFFRVVIGIISPADPMLKSRPALVLDETDKTVDLLPIESRKCDAQYTPHWGFSLEGKACSNTSLLKSSFLCNQVVRVRKNSVWARGIRDIGKIEPEKDLRFAQAFTQHLFQASCLVIEDTEMPRFFVRGTGRSPLSAMTYRAAPYHKLV